MIMWPPLSSFFFFNDTATTEIYTLSLHDALPIWQRGASVRVFGRLLNRHVRDAPALESLIHQTSAKQSRKNLGIWAILLDYRSEEHTSELQSQSNLVCRLLLEKKKEVGLLDMSLA